MLNTLPFLCICNSSHVTLHIYNLALFILTSYYVSADNENNASSYNVGLCFIGCLQKFSYDSFVSFHLSCDLVPKLDKAKTFN